MGSKKNVVPMSVFGHKIEVEYYYYPGEDEVHTESNGDPGTPGSPPSAEIWRMWCELENDEGSTSIVDISEFGFRDMIAEEIIEKFHD